MASATTVDTFQQELETFNRQVSSLGFPDVANYYWYHTVELPNGLVTPGVYDFRHSFVKYGFPQDMRGMRVLDVGSATGFFAFEFARRGAEVMSVELPSLYALDRFPGQDIEQTLEKLDHMMARNSANHHGGRYTAEQLYFYLLEGPFEFCRSQLNLPIKRCYSTVYDLTLESVGGQYDLVFMGDILLHTINPLRALAAVAPLCRWKMMLTQVIPGRPEDPPIMQYVGGDALHSDEVSWWVPNLSCFIALLKKLGFHSVVEFVRYTGIMRPSGHVFEERSILHAEK